MKNGLTLLQRLGITATREQILIDEELLRSWLHGPLDRPIIQGDQAMLAAGAIDTPRNIVEQEPTVFVGGEVAMTAGTIAVIFRPQEPLSLQRIYLSSNGTSNIFIGNQEGLTDFDAFSSNAKIFVRTLITDQSLEINLGRKGLIIGPQAPLVARASATGGVQWSLMLAPIQLAPG